VGVQRCSANDDLWIRALGAIDDIGFIIDFKLGENGAGAGTGTFARRGAAQLSDTVGPLVLVHHHHHISSAHPHCKPQRSAGATAPHRFAKVLVMIHSINIITSGVQIFP
jgi:hypothetical protein